MSWTSTTFEDAPVAIIDGDRGKNYPSQNQLLEEGHCLFLSATNVTKNGFAFETCQFVSQEKHEALRKGTVDYEDIILTTRGTLGNVARYTERVRFSPIRINSGMVTMKPDGDALRSDYLYYYVKSDLFQSQVRALQSGAAQPQLPIRDIKKITLNYPELPTQQRIAGILSAYDDLIENNRRRIGLLEQAARLLYREWFVHLRFPGHETAKLVDGLPEGWNRVTLAKVCSRITDGSHSSPQSVEDGFPMASVKDMHDWGIATNSCRLISRDDFDHLVKADCKPRLNDVLIAKDGSYLKHCFVVQKEIDLVILSSIAILRPNQLIDPHLLAMTLRDPQVKERMKGYVSGAALPRIILREFRNFEIALPPTAIQEQWAALVHPLNKQCFGLIQHNESRARDLLLPRLMDGRIPV
jgi:type I restriction enzyme S subunit